LRGPHHSLLNHAVHHDAAIQIGAEQPDHSGISDPFLNAIDEDVVIHSIKGSHYTLPIISTFPRELQLFALGIRLKVNLSTFFDRLTEKADWC